MLAINPINSDTIMSLRLLKPLSPTAKTPHEPRLTTLESLPTGVSYSRISPGVQHAISEINRIINSNGYGSPLNRYPPPYERLNERVEINHGNFMEPAQTLDQLSDYESEQIRSFGIEPEWVRRVTPTELSDEQFHTFTLSFLESIHSNDPAFIAARDNGSLNIRRIRDIDGIEQENYLFAHLGGSVGFTKSIGVYEDKMRLRADGVHQTTGGVLGNDYYVTWPDQSLKSN